MSMRKTLTVAMAGLLVCIIVASAQATETVWRLKIKVDDGNGSYAGASGTFGISTASTDGVDTFPGEMDLEQEWISDIGQWLSSAVGVIAPDTRTWRTTLNDDAAPQTYAGGTKRWHIRIAAGPNAIHSVFRVQFHTVNSALMMPSSVGGAPVQYKLVMTDNKGVVGAPGNGTAWTIPIPSAHTGTPFYTLPVTLPVLRMSLYNHTAMINEGYQLELQQIVPDPSSFVALGMGAIGVMGFMLRRRRA